MDFPILGLHHVTATVDQAQADLDFCVGALGLRLVKKTVNFDNHGVYHFYYGDEVGHPGTIWTTFPYGGRGVPVGTKGVGQITVTSFSVPPDSLPQWKARLEGRGCRVTDAPPRFGGESVIITDPSGLGIELVTAADTRAAWTGGGVDADMAVRGLHSVTMTVRDPAPTLALFRDLLGFVITDEMEGQTRVGVNGGGPGKTIDIIHSSRAAAAAVARNGIGTVHHVATAITDADEQLRLHAELVRRGVHVTAVMDRQYFRSIYFREPGGVLLEVATAGPGFSVDESVTELGQSLKLPEWEEVNRGEIESQLPEIVAPSH